MKMGGMQLLYVLVAVGSGALSVPLREPQQLSPDPLVPDASSVSVASPLPMAHAQSNDTSVVTGAGGLKGGPNSGLVNRPARQNSQCCGADATSTVSPVKREIGSGEQPTCCGLESSESCCGASLQQDTPPDTGSGKTKRDSGCCGLEGGDHATCCGLEKNETFCCGKQRIARSERDETSYDRPDNVATRMARETNLGEGSPCCGSEDSTKTPQNPEKPKRSTCCGSPVDEPPVDTLPETITKEKRETCCGLEENESNKCCGLHDTVSATTPAQKVKRCPQTSTAIPA